ncbi:unnamed protein product [Pleuronectes platessa]|uniref:Uncharacterized protein n=1 Tax=Pleuronectes platessa TaxID=8262 RepID=A0A9N7VAF6_PLEPL|nr:unnamed protein product [Pleuronectes platessa]
MIRMAVRQDTGRSSSQIKAITGADCSPITIRRHLRRKGFKNKTSSPDLNPIENIWGWMAREVYKNGLQFQTVDALREAIFTTWRNIHLHQACQNEFLK